MAVAYVFDGVALKQMNLEVARPRFIALDTPLRSDCAVACLREGEFYVVSRSVPNVLRHYGEHGGNTTHTLPGPVHCLLVHRQKLYCGGTDCLYVFDPLCGEVETINFEQKIKDFVAADHGFVFVTERRELYAFHFIRGVKAVGTKGPVNKLLGHHNHHAVVLLDTGDVISVNEEGEIREGIFTLKTKERFVALKDDMALALREEGGLSFYLNGSWQDVEDIEGTNLQIFSIPPSPAEDACTICFCDFEDGDGVRLDCGHPFHRDCLAEFSVRANGFVDKGEHIVFTYAVCPSGCGAHIRHAAAPLSTYMNELYRIITKDSENRLREMGNKTLEDLYYYICCRCEKPYYGGNRQCSRTISGEPSKKPSELICSNCNEDFLCTTHKHGFVLYKCRYCCNPATHLSFGNRYMCNGCNEGWQEAEPEVTECPGVGKCPLGGEHPSGGSVPLGCMLCTVFDKFDAKLIFQQ